MRSVDEVLLSLTQALSPCRRTPDLRLPSQPQKNGCPATGTKLLAITEARECKQLAQGRYLATAERRPLDLSSSKSTP